MSVFEPKTITLRDGAAVHLRSPDESDAAGMLDYIDEVRRDCDGILLSPEDHLPTLDWEREWVRGNRDGAGIQIYAHDEHHEQVALCSVKPGTMARTRHRGSLGISIRKPWRGRGLGTALMNELIAWSQSQSQLTVLTLTVIDDNPYAQRLYESVGFVATGRARWSIRRRDRYADEVFMSRWVGPNPAPT